jgi:hypothetical protein
MRVPTWVSDHSGAIFGFLVAMTLVVSGSVVRCTAIHAPGADTPTAEEVAESELDDDIRDLRKGYTAETKEALALIGSNVWVGTDGTTVVEPTEKAILTRAGDTESCEAYAVCASMRESVSKDGVPTTVTTMCVETNEWTDIAVLTVPAAMDGNPPAPATLKCPSICGGATLTLSAACKDVTLDGPDRAILEARGTTPEAVRSLVSSWCGTWRPTATTATWDRVVEEDHDKRAFRFSYTLDDARKTAVTVSVPMDGSEPTVGEGGR